MSAPGEDPHRPRAADSELDRARSDGESPLGELHRKARREDREQIKPRRKRKHALEARDARGRLLAVIDRPRRHRVWRFAWRAAVVLGVILLLGIIAIQIILSTSLPRNIVVSALQKQFGLRIDANSMTTGWLGHTTLNKVTLALPLAEESFLEVPRLKVTHTNLIMLLLRRPLHIDSVELVKPRLIVRQDVMGRWNVDEAFALITRASGGRSAAAEQQEAGTPVQLPSMNVTDGTVVIVDNTGNQSEVAPLSVVGQPQSPVAWTFSAKAPHLDVQGRVAPGQNWQHVVVFSVDEMNRVLAPWFADAPSPMRLTGEWHGTVANNGVAGRADLKSSQIGRVALAGVVDVTEADGVATLTPQTLVANVAELSPTPIRFTGGSFKMSGTHIEAQQVRVGVMGGAARLDGQFDWHAKSGSIDAAWTDMLAPGGARHEGTIKATLDTPWANRPRIKADVTTKGFAQQRHWDGALRVTGDGRSWNDIDWTVDVPRLTLAGPKRTADLHDVGFQVVTTGRVLRLADLHMADTDRMRGYGAFDTRTKDWWVWLDLRQLDLPRFTRPVDLLVQASGNLRRIDIQQLEWMAGKSHVWVAGSYELSRPKPLEANVYLWRLPFEVSDPARRAMTGSAGMRGKLHAAGIVLPLNVDLDGELLGSKVYFGKRQLGDLAVRVNGHLGDELATFESTKIKLLDGDWSLKGQYTYEEQWGSVDVNLTGLSLKQLDGLVAPPPDARGVLAADVHIEWPHRDLKQLSAVGTWTIKDLAKSGLLAENAGGRLEIQGDEIDLNDIVLRHGAGLTKGKIRYNMREGERLSVDLAAIDWPVELPQTNGALKLNGETKLDIDFKSVSAIGPVSIRADATRGGQYFGSMTFQGAMAGQELVIDSAQARAFGGTLEGSGKVGLRDWTQSTAHFDIRGVEADQIVQMWPRAAGLGGTYSGVLDVRHNLDPHATDPLVAEFRIIPTAGHFNAAAINNMQLTFTASPDRLILSQGVLNIAGGEIAAWGRLSKHPGGVIGHTQIELHNLNIDQLVHAFSTTERETAGIVDGEITVFGPLNHKDQLNGEANLKFSRMGLLNLDVLSAMYASLNPTAGPPPPEGRGVAYLRLEQGTLSLINGFYRNKGIYVRVQAQAQDVFQGAASSVSGFAVGTARPLNQIKLPFFAQVDDIFSALQHAATTFKISGNLGSPKLQGAGFNEVGEGLLRLFVDDVKGEVGTSVGR
jgi:hypothetical protein